jgi:glycine/D-amino acid oxidase-like deaminating enzyme
VTQRELIGVVGAGFMGSGIAESTARAGLHVVLYEPDDSALQRAHGRIAESVGRGLARQALRGRRGGAARANPRDHLARRSLRRAGRRRGDRRGPDDQGRGVPRTRPPPAQRARARVEHVVDPHRAGRVVDRDRSVGEIAAPAGGPTAPSASTEQLDSASAMRRICRPRSRSTADPRVGPTAPLDATFAARRVLDRLHPPAGRPSDERSAVLGVRSEAPYPHQHAHSRAA